MTGEDQFETILTTSRATLYESELLQMVWRADIAPRFDLIFLCD
jgi:hypothetical protein